MDKCPYDFNFDAATFKPGDFVSYRVPGSFGEMPFVGRIVAVHDDCIEIATDDPMDRGHTMKATRASRPVVSDEAALAQGSADAR